MSLSFVKGPQRSTGKAASSAAPHISSKRAGKSKISVDIALSAQQDEEEEEDWVSKYRPALEEVAVHHSYEKSVRDWLTRATRAHIELGNRPGFRPFVLALCGPSGCGKSALIEALCAKMRFNIIEWTDDVWTTPSTMNSGGTDGHGDSVRWNGGDSSASGSVALTKEEELGHFVRASAYPSLSLTAKQSKPSHLPPPVPARAPAPVAIKVRKAAPAGPKHSSHTEHEVIVIDDSSADESKADEKERQRKKVKAEVDSSPDIEVDYVAAVTAVEPSVWKRGRSNASSSSNRTKSSKSKPLKSKKKKRSSVDSSGSDSSGWLSDSDDAAAVDSDGSFESMELVPRSRKRRIANAASRKSKSKTAAEGKSRSTADLLPLAKPVLPVPEPVPVLPYLGSIVLLHDLPHVMTGFGDSSDKSDSARYGRLLGLFTHPVVMICSGIGGKDDMHYASRSFLPDSAKDVVYLETIYQAGATPIAITKALQRICTLEAKAGHIAAKSMKKEILQGIAESAMGDVRHAVIQLQLTLLSQGKLERPASAAVAAAAGGAFHDDDDGGKSLRRDLHTSSLHAVAKLANAQLDMHGFLHWDVSPDSVIASTDMDNEMVYTMLQAHVLPAIEASCKREESAIGIGCSDADAASAPDAPTAVPDIEQVAAALSTCSDLAILLSTKYDSNSHLDRAVGSAFPDEYVSAITSRFAAVSKGVGAAERTSRAKKMGGKGVFLPVRRAPILDVRTKSAVTAAHLHGLACDLASFSGGWQGHRQGNSLEVPVASAMVPSIREVALNVAPMLGTIYRANGQLLQHLGPRVKWRLAELSRLAGHSVGVNHVEFMARLMHPPVPAAGDVGGADGGHGNAMEVEVEEIGEFDD